MKTATHILGNLLEYLYPDGWIEIEEVIKQIGITPAKSMEILDFLSEFEFIAFDSNKRMIKLVDLGNRFIKLPDI